MDNNNRPTAQIIDFDNYDPFGANGTGQTQIPSPSDIGQTTFSPTSSSSIDHLNRLQEENDQNKGSKSILSLDYYKVFFDVKGDQVLQRAIASLYPFKGHLEQNIRGNPDFYGPVWISVSLILTSAISHGIAQFIENAPNCVAVDTDMRRTSFVMTVVFLYTFLLPSSIWAFLKYQNAGTRQPLASYICLYGYSMAVFIPISILWVLRIPMVMWPVMLGAAAITAYSLVSSLWPSLEGISAVQTRILVSIVVVAFHVGLAIALGSYAFEPTVTNASTVIVPPTPIITVPPIPVEAPKS